MSDHVDSGAPADLRLNFYALDKYHAMTYVRGSSQLTGTVRDAVLEDLNNLQHSGPVFIEVAGDLHAVRPFEFVQV